MKTQILPLYQNPKIEMHFQKRKNFRYGNQNRKPKRNINNFQQNDNHSPSFYQEKHKNDLICFQHCSKWTAQLSTYIGNSKSFISSEELSGNIHQIADKYNNQKSNFQISDELNAFFPIDIRANQRFALDKNQPKIPLQIEFDLFGKNTSFSQITNDFSKYVFEFNLNASIHNKQFNNSKQIFKDNIIFRVKGYDIMKSIQSRMLALSSIKNIIRKEKQDGFNFYYANVFNNIQCSFGVYFSITNDWLSKFLDGAYYSYHLMGQYQIKITKLKIIYSLPLIVFTRSNNINNNNILQTPHQNTINNPKTFCVNFCNWHSFMSSTTPIIFENEHLSIKDIFDAFKHSSLFGIGCLFRFDNCHYTKAQFFPNLNSLYINNTLDECNSNNQTQNQNNNNNNTGVNNNGVNNNDNSTLDGSLITSISSNQDEKNSLSCLNKQIYFKEKEMEVYNLHSFNEQYQSLVKANPGIEELTLNDILPDSYFSIIWSFSKCPQPNGYTKTNENMKFIETDNFFSFEVFYNFRRVKISNSAHYLPVIGIIDRNIKGEVVDSYNSPLFDGFWFMNKAGQAQQYGYEQFLYLNKKAFYNYKENANDLEL